MKKLLSLVLAFALVLTSMSVAFASSTAPASDVADEDVKVAVERLAALGIIAGKADGKFHEDDPLTREEFAKILALLVDLGKAAEAAKGTTRFSDVPATNWASGFINVAVGKGLILGRGDGTFGLGVKVTSEEVITMLIRALGYKDSWLEGTWPANMVNFADEIGLLDDVDFVPGFATRGVAAQLVNAALSKDTVTKAMLGPDGEYSYGGTLLEELGIEEVTGVVTSNVLVNADLDENEINLVWTDEEEEEVDETYAVVQEEINVDTLIGREIECLIDDDEIILVSAVNGTELVGSLSGLEATPEADDEISVLALDGEETEDLVLTDDTLVFINREAQDLADLDDGMFGTVVVNDDDEIVSVIAYTWTESELLVTEYAEDDEVIRFFDLASEAELDLTDYDAIVVDGAVDALEDIEANDVIYVSEYEFDDDAYAYIYVVRNVAKGEIGRLSAAGDSIKVDGESYDLIAGEATYSDNANKDLAVYTAKAQLNDFIGEEATVALNIIGAVRNIVIGELGGADVLFGVYVEDSAGTSYSASAGRQYFVDIYVPAEDDTLTYEVDKDVYTDVFAGFTTAELVAFTIDGDGIIDAAADITVSADLTALDDSLTYVNLDVDELDEDYDFIGGEGSEYFVVADTILADVEDIDDPAAYAWDDIKGDTLSPAVATHIVYNEDDEARFVAFTAALDATAGDTLFALVTDKYYAGDDADTITLTLPDGTTVDMLLEVGGAISDTDEYSIIAYTLAGDDFASVTEMVYGVEGNLGTVPTGYTHTPAIADRVSGTRLYTRDAGAFVIDSDAVVYVVDVDEEETVLGTTSDIRYNRALRVFTDDSNGRAVVIVVIK